MKKSIEKTEKNRENIVDKAAINMYYIQARFESPMVSGRARGDLENDTGSDIRGDPDEERQSIRTSQKRPKA